MQPQTHARTQARTHARTHTGGVSLSLNGRVFVGRTCEEARQRWTEKTAGQINTTPLTRLHAGSPAVRLTRSWLMRLLWESRHLAASSLTQSLVSLSAHKPLLHRIYPLLPTSKPTLVFSSWRHAQVTAKTQDLPEERQRGAVSSCIDQVLSWPEQQDDVVMKRWLIRIEVAGVSRETLCWQGLQGSTACYDLIFFLYLVWLVIRARAAVCCHHILSPGWEVGPRRVAQALLNISVQRKPPKTALCCCDGRLHSQGLLDAFERRSLLIPVLSGLDKVWLRVHAGCTVKAQVGRRAYLSACWWVEMPTVQCSCEFPSALQIQHYCKRPELLSCG